MRISERLKRLRRLPYVAKMFRAMNPSYGHCLICGLPWNKSGKHHTVSMRECTDDHCGEGFFPVCEYCWQHAGLDAILTAVRRLYNMWLQQDCHPYELDDMIEATIRDYYEDTDELIAEAMERHLSKESET